MDDLISAIDALGGVAGYRLLDDLGFDRRRIAREVANGGLDRIRSGWFATASAPLDLVRAVRVGGTLTGASVARICQLWTLADERLHVRVPSTASRLASPDDRGRPLDAIEHVVCVHYSSRPAALTAMDGIPDALVEMFRCGDVRSAAVALDSALNKRLIGPADLRWMRTHIPVRKQRVFDRADAGAQSGLETLVRLLLAAHNVRFRSQVWLEPAGRVDLLVGDRLVLELDGAEFHTGAAFEEDRRRDLALTMQGYLVVRLSYRMITYRWNEVAASILELIRRDEHLWRGSGRRSWTYAG
ncbi:DUF559 domain-containing protein [Rathayibacter sp. YIM 133350]|uniref:endonuclease domain-containing protein n=1 Tax=Rathayibacter sp. YIM 133350 TaxID=3131992 RepID=UPI00307DCC9D